MLRILRPIQRHDTRRCDDYSSTSTHVMLTGLFGSRARHARCIRHTATYRSCDYVRALQRPRQNDVLENGLYKTRLNPPRRQGFEARALQSTACMRSLAQCQCAAITHHAAAERARKRDAARRRSSQHCSAGRVGASLTPWHASIAADRQRATCRLSASEHEFTARDIWYRIKFRQKVMSSGVNPD